MNITQSDVLPAVRVAHAQLPTDPVERWRTVIPVVEDLKAKAKELGLWNLFLSKANYPGFGVPLTNLEVGGQVIPDVRVFDHFVLQYAVMAEIMAHAGRLGSEATNCSAPDTGNMGTWSNQTQQFC